jgi:hypothetical protein
MGEIAGSPMTSETTVASMTDVGSIGVCHLKRLWSSSMAERGGRRIVRDDEWHQDRLVLDGLGLGLHQTIQFLFDCAPSFAEFEEWIVQTAGMPGPRRVERLNADILGEPYSADTQQWLAYMDASEPVLTEQDLRLWDQEGYVVVRQAVSPDDCRVAESAIWKRLGANSDDPETWYGRTDHGIMVELMQNAAFESNRRAERVHKAFSQLWATAALWPSADRCGFHPPQRVGHEFPGPDLHWDVDFKKSLAFGTQGILYLTDTPPEQGALTLVPGFHLRFERWLDGLDGRDPQQEDLHALGPMPVSGSAGDLVIWNQHLPHGSRPNVGMRPRIVQYINMYPGRAGARI